MKDGVLIGIDAGTSVIKSIAFSVDGTQLASAAIPNSLCDVAGWWSRTGHGPHLG